MSEEITIPSAGTIRTMIANLESACSQVMEQYRRNLDANPDDEMLQEQAETISQFQTTLKRWRIKFQADFEPDPGPGGDPDLTDPEEKRPHVRYVGEIKDNLPDAVYVTTHRPQSVRQDLLDSRLDLQRYAPSGFQWGHPGNGAAQLALAILAHNTENDDYARDLPPGIQEGRNIKTPMERLLVHRGWAGRQLGQGPQGWWRPEGSQPEPGPERRLPKTRPRSSKDRALGFYPKGAGSIPAGGATNFPMTRGQGKAGDEM